MKMNNFIEKSSSAMKLISGSMALLISKICVIDQQKTKMCFLRHNRFIKKQIRWKCYLEKWSGRTAASFMRSNAIGFLFIGPYQVTGLWQQANNFRRPQRQHPTRSCQVPVEMCASVVENWVQRIDRCKRARGGYMTDIEFHSWNVMLALHPQ